MQFINPQKLIDSLKWRYACKKFDSQKKIPDDLWKTLEESFVLTASSYGLQPWQFVVVQNPELRKKLRAVSWNQAQVEDCSHYVVLTSLKTLDEPYIDTYIEDMAKTRNIGVDGLAGFKKAVVSDLVAGPRSKGIPEWASRQAYIALGNLLSSAGLLGIDTCAMEGLDPLAYDQILDLEKTPYRTSVALAFGYRASDDKYAGLPKVRFSAQKVFKYLK